MRLLHTLGKDTHNTVLLNPLENNKSPVRLGGRSMTTWTKKGRWWVQKCRFLLKLMVRIVPVGVGRSSKKGKIVPTLLLNDPRGN